MSKMHFPVVLVSLLSSITIINATILRYKVLEDQQPKTVVGQPKIDLNLTAPSLHFKFMPERQSGAELFSLPSHGRNLQTAQRIDREAVCPGARECKKTLSVAITGGARLMRIYMEIEILDQNDNSPQFPQPVFNLSISEQRRIGSNFSLPVAIDLDSPTNAVQEYRLESHGAPFQLIASNQPVLRLNSSLDRETVDSYSMRLLAFDGGSPPRNGSVLIRVTVTDANDECPVFNQSSYNVRVNESASVGKVIVMVVARDADTGDNGRIQYSLKGTNLFRIDPFSGAVSVNQPLDYDDRSPDQAEKRYDFEIHATDLAPIEGIRCSRSVPISVLLLDENDQKPTITLSAIGEATTVSVTEGAPENTDVAFVLVEDNDQGSAISCQLTPTDRADFILEPFNSDSRDGTKREYIIKARRTFDREERAVYNPTIECSDNGIPAQSQSKTFRVFVVDRNDERPTFIKNSYEATISESIYIGGSVVTVQASDADDPDSPNSQITYTLSGEHSDWFTITDNGHIAVRKSVDAESLIATNGMIELTVTAQDNAVNVAERKSSSAQLKILVRDVNDNAPVFSQPMYDFSIEENQPRKAIGQISATDLDVTTRDEPVVLTLSYNGNIDYQNKFELRDGTLYTKRGLNREEKSEYQLEVIATDRGSPPKTASTKIWIRVLDVNDNTPSITWPESSMNDTVHTSYLAGVGRLLGTIRAFDPDNGNNGTLNFTIFQTTPDRGLFQLDEYSGELTVAKPLGIQNRGVYALQIIVSDRGTPKPNAIMKPLTIIVTNPDGVEGFYGQTGQQSHQNLVIVVILIAISTVLAFMIIVLMVCLRRRDSNASGADQLKPNFSATGCDIDTNNGPHSQHGIMRNVEVVMDCQTMKQVKGDISYSPIGDHNSTNSDTNLIQPHHGAAGGHMQDAQPDLTRYVTMASRSTNYATLRPYSPAANGPNAERASPCDSGKGGSDEDSNCSKQPQNQQQHTNNNVKPCLRTFSPHLSGTMPRNAAVVPPQVLVQSPAAYSRHSLQRQQNHPHDFRHPGQPVYATPGGVVLQETPVDSVQSPIYDYGSVV